MVSILPYVQIISGVSFVVLTYFNLHSILYYDSFYSEIDIWSANVLNKIAFVSEVFIMVNWTKLFLSISRESSEKVKSLTWFGFLFFIHTICFIYIFLSTTYDSCEEVALTAQMRVTQQYYSDLWVRKAMKITNQVEPKILNQTLHDYVFKICNMQNHPITLFFILSFPICFIGKVEEDWFK